MTLQETIENICENQIPKEVNGVSTKYVVSVHSLENLGEVVEIAILPTHMKSIDIGVKMQFTHRVFYEKKLEQDIRELLCMYVRNIIGWTDHRVIKEITYEEWVKSEDGDDEFTEGYNCAIDEIRECIDTMPTIETEPVKQDINELLNECRETIFGATYTSGEEYTHAITLCDKISAVIGEGKQ